ncbi:MAG: AcrID1 family anti-CRISPR protein, partial [Nitrososphaeria archaeon]
PLSLFLVGVKSPQVKNMNIVKSDEEMKRTIIKFIDLFFEDYVKEFDIKLDEITFTEDEFNDLIGKYDSSNGAINNDVYTDEYTYDINDMDMKKLIIDYIKTDDGKYVILSIQGFNDMKQSGDNNE